jgi:hypothetical protein
MVVRLPADAPTGGPVDFGVEAMTQTESTP